MNVTAPILAPDEKWRPIDHGDSSFDLSFKRWANIISTGPRLDRRANFSGAVDSLWPTVALERNSDTQRTLIESIRQLGRNDAGLDDQSIEFIIVGAKVRYGDPEAPPAAQPVLFTKAEFIGGFVPPDYLIDDILQRRYVYGLTASTGHGKTAVALLISRLVSDHTNPHPIFGRHAVDHGTVIYFAGENPEDLRARVIADDSCAGRDGSADRIAFIPGTHSIDDMAAVCRAELPNLGGKADLIVVDTSAAYFPGDNENDNPQMGNHARTLRRLTELPGGPTVLVLCHPAKHVQEAANLQPRGGGAFIAELDGNLTLWKTDDLAELSHNKMRGPGFEPLTLRLERITCAELVDSKGRAIPSVRAVAVTDADQEIMGKAARADEDLLLIALLEPGQSIAQLAVKCGWVTAAGEPHKSKAHRRLNALAKAGLAKQVRGSWELSDKGRTAADSATRPAKPNDRTEAGK